MPVPSQGLQGMAGDRLLLISVYMPAKGSKNHQIEYHDCVDQFLYELYQKNRDSHTIIIGGDMNEDSLISTPFAA
jgi:exonuclease III